MVELEVQDFEKNKKTYKLVENELKNVLGENVRVDHVGSTAIPDMCGKNIIDVLVGATTAKDFARKRTQIENMGYFASQNSKSEIYQFFASKQGETSSGDTHIHLAIMRTDRYEDFLTLRDYLLRNKKEAEDYSNYKKKLIELGVTDRKRYRATKSEYVSALIERARQSRRNIIV